MNKLNPKIAEMLAKPYEMKFPLQCFPIVREGGGLKTQTIPVLGLEGIEAIEKSPGFHAWARDPRTGVINIELDAQSLKECVDEWLAASRAQVSLMTERLNQA